ncbi:MAG TPA: XRE family transcriptional regulator [Verrucomicrobiae bacterium]|jgi:Zn-dependent peptidase ImmA (M78 family)/transcriptional regulator with XRE-family HTH domain|nr:XRE family transcriptional regulator [Verrucomicrobiae bacterium]
MTAILKPAILRWARSNAGLTESELAEKLRVSTNVIKNWETTGEIKIKFIQKVADATRTAFGYLFLDEPPQTDLPIADFRRTNSSQLTPTSNLLEAIYDAQLKQAWYKDYLVANGAMPLGFVGSCTLDIPHKDTANDIRKALGIGPRIAEVARKWEDAIRCATEAVEDNGIIVLRSGHIRGDTSRTLSVDEFRGFALVDDYAPLIFINGADAPAAQLFTIAHELAHIWVGKTGVSNLDKTYSTGGRVEIYCNTVAAEVLLPIEELKSSWKGGIGDISDVNRISDKYKVSRIVVARRARDAGLMTEEQFDGIYRMISVKKSSGGNYYTNEAYQNSRLFSIALVQETISGRISEGDAMRYLGIKKADTFKNYANSLKEGMEWHTY